jgi:hypothetical protein
MKISFLLHRSECWSAVGAEDGRVPAPGEAAGCHVTMPDTGMAAGPTCANAVRRCHQPGAMPAMAMAAPPCRLQPRRHVPRVAWPGVPPPPGGLFCQTFSELVLFDNTLAQVV